MNSFFAAIFVLFFLGACATQPKNLPQQTRYSPETEKTFLEIERERLLEHYRQMRIEEGIMQNDGTYQKVAKPRVIRPRPTPPAPKKPAPRAQVVERVKVDEEAQKMELEQNLSFFCMKKRSDSRFSNDGSCEEFTAQVKNECLEKYQTGDKGLLSCVKSQLK